MSKKLDTTSIQNELTGQSVFFQRPQKQEPNNEKESVHPVREVRDVRAYVTYANQSNVKEKDILLIFTVTS